MDEFSISFTDPMIVDLDLFSMWLKGVPDHECAKQLAITASANVGDVPLTILLQEVKEQNALFRFLQQYLQSPLMLNANMLCSLPPRVKQNLIQSYYAFDKEVIREILGKKMNSKLRKDMDDVSEKTGVSLQSCQRQFDNIKNVLKVYEDMEGSITEIINKQFLLPETLARMYRSVVFLFINRFETLKRKLQYLVFDDFIVCTEYILDNWTAGAVNEPQIIVEQNLDVDEIDKEFVHDLRDLRNFLSEKEVQDLHRSIISALLEKKSLTLHFTKSLDSNFRLLSRNMFSIGAQLSNSKELKEFFVNCIEKIIETVKQLEWSIKELETFLSAMCHAWTDMKKNAEYASIVTKLDPAFKRYMEVMKKCLLQLYR